MNPHYIKITIIIIFGFLGYNYGNYLAYLKDKYNLPIKTIILLILISFTMYFTGVALAS